MGCEYRTVDGKRIRVGRVGPSRAATMLGTMDLSSLMSRLGISLMIMSPAVTIDELKDATFRLWRDPEIGYVVEFRMTPGAVPHYHTINQLDATALESGTASKELIGRLLHTPELAIH